MNNFELRWLERETGRQLMNEHGYYYREIERVLQYRIRETVTDYKLSLDDGTYLTTTVWTAWTDVPTVRE